ncbi:MAG: patatin-like phospholipase family protein [Cyclobacteriaceae bacterium]|nr:patatin-like phospholipase family protein [Cyclobacteriaceae bacterium]
MTNTRFNILALDGGGTRGLFPATILDCIAKGTGKSPTEIFDVIVGSATGGIITAALAAGLSTDDIVDIYLNRADYILPSNFLRRLWNPLNLFAPKYPNSNLKQLLGKKIGDLKLGDVSNKYGTKPVFLFAALDMSPEIPAGQIPEFKVVIYNSAHTEHREELLVDIALRSSAAVVNLPMYGTFTEGGNYANDPGMVGLSFVLNAKQGANPDVSLLPDSKLGLGAPLDGIKMFSLGCGSTGSSFIPENRIGKGNWGLIRWLKYLVNLVIDTNMVAAQYYLDQILPEDNYLRINAWYGADDAPEVLRKKKLKIDVTDKQQLLAIRSYAEKKYAENQADILRFLGF